MDHLSKAFALRWVGLKVSRAFVALAALMVPLVVLGLLDQESTS
jgi:hypothetical protein